MPEVTLTRPTRYGGVGRKSGEVVEVDDKTADRWAANGIAKPKPKPEPKKESTRKKGE